MVNETGPYEAVIIGTGFSGICMAIKLLARGITNFVVLEKANDLGGTWRENTYPGAECDIPSALYSYSFEPYPDWEYKWSHQPQILKYIRYCASKYKVDDHIIYNQNVENAAWNEDKSNWQVTTTRSENYIGKSLISAIGQLHYPSLPTIEGAKNFEGDSWHSAKWNHSIPLKGKRIGVIGNAASAIQFIPEIANQAAEITIFQRTANWMLPKQDRLYRNWEKALVRKFPFLLKLYRLKIWLLGGALFLLMIKGNTPLRKFYQWRSKKYIKDSIIDKDLVEKLIPQFPFGAKRVLFSDNYYETLAKKHVQLITNPISKITSKGIQTNAGENYNLDVIIFATGFKTNPFFQKIKIQGRNKINLSTQWQKAPKTYLGVSVSNFPNFYIMYGPNTNLGHNSIIIMSEVQASYISQAIEISALKEITELEVKSDVMESYHKEIQKRLKKMIWDKIEKSWYKSADGNNPNNWPGRTMEYMKRLKHFNLGKYTVKQGLTTSKNNIFNKKKGGPPLEAHL